MLAPGRSFEEKYRIISELGTGSFAIVAKARHEIMGRDVALKCLKPSVVRSNPEVSERFVNEVQIVSRLRHPNTVTIFDFGQTSDDLAYMVLEYLDGETLDEAIFREGALSEARTIGICRQIMKSLAEAHDLGIIHRDLKPSNIMLTQMHGEPDFVKVLDFGVAKLLEESEAQDSKFEPRSTQFIGTPVYMSPEQVLGRSVTPASDLYSLGLLIYEMLTGQPPIELESVASVVREHLEDSPLPFAELASISEPLQEVILKCTARDPSARFATVREFAQALPVDGATDSIDRMRPKPEVAAPQAGLAQETSEPDVFSGKHYIAPPESNKPDAHEKMAGPSQPSELIAPAPSRPPKRGGPPSPSFRADELDLDLETVNRQRERVHHRRHRQGSSSRDVDGGWEASEYWTRYVTYGVGLVAAHWGFVILTAMMSGQSGTARVGAGVLMVVSAVMWTNFSSVQAVGVDFGRRWVLPTAKNFVYIFCAIAVAATLGRPGQTAKGLSTEPTWFYEGLPGIPPLSWMDAATTWIALKLAPFFTYVGNVLPY
jgi:serine/threonine protein kinase